MHDDIGKHHASTTPRTPTADGGGPLGVVRLFSPSPSVLQATDARRRQTAAPIHKIGMRGCTFKNVPRKHAPVAWFLLEWHESLDEPRHCDVIKLLPPETNARFARSLGIDDPMLSEPAKGARASGVRSLSGFASRWTFYDKQVSARSHGRDVSPS